MNIINWIKRNKIVSIFIVVGLMFLTLGIISPILLILIVVVIRIIKKKRIMKKGEKLIIEAKKTEIERLKTKRKKTKSFIKIFTDIKKSTKIKKLSDDFKILRDELWQLQYEILRFLEEDLNKEVLNGSCDYCIYKKKERRERRKENLRLDLFHKYLHE